MVLQRMQGEHETGSCRTVSELHGIFGARKQVRIFDGYGVRWKLTILYFIVFLGIIHV